MTAKVEKKLKSLGRIVGELIHEIKNPLSTIKVNLQLVAEQLQSEFPAEDNLTKRLVRKISVVQKETDRVEMILNDFLRYVRSPEPQISNVNINELVEDMIGFYSPQAQNHHVTIRQTIYAEPIICKVDSGMIKQAILNLFINSIQAMEAGGELIIKTDLQDNVAIISVADTGVGIESENIDKIFEVYETSRKDGSGLGLATVKKIVDIHKGSVEIVSKKNSGTMFTIKLPIFNAK